MVADSLNGLTARKRPHALDQPAMSRRQFREEAEPFIHDLEERNDLAEDYVKHKSRQYQGNSRVPRKRLAVAFILSVMLVSGIISTIYMVSINSTKSHDKKHQDVYHTAAVAADTVQCAHVGKSVLLKGGNSVDSAIATLLCSGLTCPQSMGIGGGFLMTIYNRTTGETTTIDARETAPDRATKDMFVPDPVTSSRGGLSIGVPGEMKGYWHTHQRYGSLPWNDLFQPTIKMATEGFPVPESLAQALEEAEEDMTSLQGFREVFVNPKTGKLYATGEMMKRPKLAKTLKVIAEEGGDAFYSKTLADAILKDLVDVGSIISRDDLQNYTVVEKDAIGIKLDSGSHVFSLPPPSSGAILAFILNILDGYHFSSESMGSKVNETLTYHRFVEAFKFAYALRSDLGDEDYIDVKDLVHNLTSRDYADHIRKSLITDNSTHNTSYYGGTFYDHFTTGTSHLCVIDQNGSAVSVTSTINGRFGSRTMGKRTGIIFNNEMDDFSSPNITNIYGIKPSPANFIVPGKRPLSSMCPAVVVNPEREVIGIFGAAGGSKITTATAWVMAHTLWLGNDVQKAVERPRLHHQLLPPYIQFESTFEDKSVLSGLESKGHDLESYQVGESIVQSITVTNSGPPEERTREIYACSDYRKGGKPDGF